MNHIGRIGASLGLIEKFAAAEIPAALAVAREFFTDGEAANTGEISKAAAAKPQPQNLELLTGVPAAALEVIRKHGLLSGDELAKPENRHLLELARSGEGADSADQWLADRERRQKEMPWNTSYKGTSVLFGEPDPEKIHDKHPTKRFNTKAVRIKLAELLRDHPDTIVHGSELIPYEGDEAYDALDANGKDEFVQRRHHDLTPDELAVLIEQAKNPKELWKHYDDPEGNRYAGNVPHGHVIVPGGRIDPKYLDFGDAGVIEKEAMTFKPPTLPKPPAASSMAHHRYLSDDDEHET